MNSPTGVELYPARLAYDLAAAEYDRWPWQEFWRRAEAPVILSWLEQSPGRRLLDLGAGTGFYLRQLAIKGCSGIGLDISAAMLGIAARQLRGTAALVQGDVRCLPFKSHSFDQILMTRVMSHIEDISVVLREVRRVLARGGSLVLSDLDASHNYTHTELPLAARKIPVETYKRTLSELAGVAEADAGLVLSRHAVIDGRDAPMNLSSIDSECNRPIAFVAQFKIQRTI
jgi:ubiquinone/menaquinone biosynthesis C-methylase UbiE